jgi:hypothetical protein
MRERLSGLGCRVAHERHRRNRPCLRGCTPHLIDKSVRSRTIEFCGATARKHAEPVEACFRASWRSQSPFDGLRMTMTARGYCA